MAFTEETKNWSMIVGGILMVFFALVAVLFPGLTLVSIAFVIAAGFLVSGVIDLMTYFRERRGKETSTWLLAYGVVDVLMALMLIFHPIAAAHVLPWLVGFCVIVFGIFEITASVALRRMGASLWGWVLFAGIAGALLGVGLFLWPALLVYYLAFFAIVRGVSLVVFGFNFSRIL